MKRLAVIALATSLGAFFGATVLAGSAVREECVTVCKDAAKFMNEKGFYPTVFEINKKEGKFVTKNTYVFLIDFEGHLLAHPYNSQYIGMDMTGNKDSNGKLFVQEYIEIAKTKGEGWTEYMYPTPEELQKTTPFAEKRKSKKISYVYRVPGKDLIMIAGFFEE